MISGKRPYGGSQERAGGTAGLCEGGSRLCHRADEMLRRASVRLKQPPPEPAIAGIVSGEFDRVTEASDAFLRMVGYHRDDLVGGHLHWSDLTPRGMSPSG